MKKLVHFVIFIIILVCLSSCNANFEDKIHAWDDGTVVKKSTCCSHGQIMYKCQFCEGTKVRELPVSTEHNYTKFIYSSSLGLCMSCNECGHLEKILSRTTPDASVLYFDEDVKTIDSSLIDYLGDLEEVVIPVSVETIEKDAFLQNPNLTKITYQGTAEQWNNLNKEEGWDNGLNVSSVECSDDSICIHDLVLVETKDATCLENGFKKYSCNNCDYTKTETIDATGHTVVANTEKTATCTETGLTGGTHCSVCNAELTASSVVSAKGHSFNAGTVTKDATCTETGTKKYSCTNCDYTKTETIDATGHTVVANTEKAATCTETGLTGGTHCSVCNAELTASSVVSATGHSKEKVEAKNETCTEAGNKEYWKCNTCGKYFSDEACTTIIAKDSWVISATGHSFDAGTIIKEPTCTETGTIKYSCTNCDYTKTETIAANGHTLTQHVADLTKCTLGYWSCSVCSKNFADSNGTSLSYNLYLHGSEKEGHALFYTDGKIYSVCRVCNGPLSEINISTKDKIINATVFDGVTNFDCRSSGNAFGNYTNLKSVTIPKSVTTIGGYVFYRCSSLATIIYEGTTEEWELIVKDGFWTSGIPATTVVTCTNGTVSI